MLKGYIKNGPRRKLLLGGIGAAGIAAAAAWRYWPEQGFWNPCHAELPRHLANTSSCAGMGGIDATRVWTATHICRHRRLGQGIYVNPATDSLLNPGSTRGACSS